MECCCHIKYFDGNNDSSQIRRDLEIDFNKYSQWKLSNKMSKIKSVNVYDMLFFLNVGKREDSICRIISNRIGNIKTSFFEPELIHFYHWANTLWTLLHLHYHEHQRTLRRFYEIPDYQIKISGEYYLLQDIPKNLNSFDVILIIWDQLVMQSLSTNLIWSISN